MATDDELAHTATAPGASQPRTPADPLGATLGRYRLERMLGEGGMGVVHAAFDPDLERRVALKVLRSASGSDEARQRLLREARAMARLTHTNVVTVHEVGTAGDRDYVAMELIDGETLADWLTSKSPHAPTPDEITAAFVAAGRGLATAHAAGLVHRDFKPHNVLRRRDGRIVVTDFGLARGVESPTAIAVALETTQPLGSHMVDRSAPPSGGAAGRAQVPAGESGAPSSLSGLTRTGSVLGTPAYMAPEQWSGGVVGSAADQFAFCVALWEALAGDRPYRGKTIEVLRHEVERGPAGIDASKLPRSLRRPLRRGLDPDPARRWPNMDALLAAITRAGLRPRMAIAGVGATLAAVGIAFLALRGGAPSACDPPVLDPDRAWSPTIAFGTPPQLADTFAKQARTWRAARGTACTADPGARPAQLRCLDGVLARFDAIRQAYSRVPRLTGEDALGSLLEPSVCLTPTPPRFTMTDSPDVIAALELYAWMLPHEGADKPPAKEAQAFAERPGLDACARAIALDAVEESETEVAVRRTAINDAVAAADQCDDDSIRAQVLIAAVPYQFELPVIGPKGQAAIRRAEVAAQRVGEPRLSALVDFLRGFVASQQEHWKEAFELIDHAVQVVDAEGLHRIALKLVVEEVELRFGRGESDDLAVIRKTVATWKPIAERLNEHRSLLDLEREDALARWSLGDVAGGHAELVRLWQPGGHIEGGKLKIEGEVVDRTGTAIAGATVAVSRLLAADSIGVPFPLARLHTGDRDLRWTTTDAAGHFVIPEGPDSGAIIAQLGDRRSIAAPIVGHERLVLAPTRRLSGKVKLGAINFTQLEIAVQDPNDHTNASSLVAPVAADGSFAVDGAPTTKLRIEVALQNRQYGTQLEYKDVAASIAPATGIELGVSATGRPLDVIARSTLTAPLDTAQIAIVPGRVQFANVGALMAHVNSGLVTQFAHHVVGEAVPHDAIDKIKSGDLTAHFVDVPAGEITVCVIGLSGDMMDSAMMRKIQAHVAELELKCETIGSDAKVAVIAAPPQKQFD